MADSGFVHLDRLCMGCDDILLNHHAFSSLDGSYKTRLNPDGDDFSRSRFRLFASGRMIAPALRIIANYD
jgi:hypothetical protein